MYAVRGFVRAASQWGPNATIQRATNGMRTLVLTQAPTSNTFAKLAAALTASAGAAFLLGSSVAEGNENGPPTNRGSWDADWDRMEHTNQKSKSKAKKQKAPTRYLVLVRHGEYHYNEVRDLTDLGRQQADETGKRLAELGIKFDHIHSSDIIRAEQTCEIISKHLPGIPVSKTMLLREGAPCEPEPAHGTWKPDPEEFYKDGARIEAGFREFFHRGTAAADVEGNESESKSKDSYELLVCHGNVIRYSVLRALQLPPEAWLRLSHANCGITVIRISSTGNVSMESFGDKGHLAPSQITY